MAKKVTSIRLNDGRTALQRSSCEKFKLISMIFHTKNVAIYHIISYHISYYPYAIYMDIYHELTEDPLKSTCHN